jgi:Ca2+-transporting ATPase
MTGQSAFANIRKCRGFMFIAAIILAGQVIIVELGGQMFNVTGLTKADWAAIIVGTSCVMWIGEVGRRIKRLKK